MTPFEPRARSGEITVAEASRIDMQAFDRLPESYRDLIRYAQIEIPATVAWAYLAAFGQRLGLLFLRWAVDVRCRKGGERHGTARRNSSSAPPSLAHGAERCQAGSRICRKILRARSQTSTA
ncbi:MAG TPA: hypothetical protein VN681_04820 [Stellaceae bacterium]|nr:hypothetical protein [Stellaceae bacterium]